MATDHDADLERWGQTPTPDVDAAFANRLEAKLRAEIIAEAAPARRWFEWVFRPGVVVLAIAAVLFGFAFFAGSTDDSRVADGPESSVPVPTTVADEPRTTTTAGRDDGDDAPPLTGTTMTTSPPTGPTTSDAPEEPAPETTAPPSLPDDATTIPDEATTIPADVTTTIPAIEPPDLVLRRDGRRVTASWTFDRGDTAIAGWVLLAVADADGPTRAEAVASTRDVSVRQLTATVTDLATTYRLEGRGADGSVIVSSDEVALNRDG